MILINKELRREGGTSGLLEVTVMEGNPMEGDASREPFGFAMDLLGPTRRPTTEKKLAVTDLKHILSPSFIIVDMFALVVPYLCAVWFIHNNDDL